MLEHIAVEGGEVFGHDHVVLQLHPEGLHCLGEREGAGVGEEGEGAGAGEKGEGV